MGLIEEIRAVTMDDFSFRIAAAVLLAIGFVVRGHYQRKFGNVMRDAPRAGRRDSICYFLVLGSFLLVFVHAASTLLEFAQLAVPAVVRWLGMFIALASLLLLAASHQALHSNWSGVLQLTDSHTLITHGPYRYIRHPMYTSLFGTAISLALMTANGVIALACLGSVVIMYVARVADEERMMHQAFGDAYAQHERRTGRLLPRLWDP